MLTDAQLKTLNDVLIETALFVFANMVVNSIGELNFRSPDPNTKLTVLSLILFPIFALIFLKENAQLRKKTWWLAAAITIVSQVLGWMIFLHRLFNLCGEFLPKVVF